MRPRLALVVLLIGSACGEPPAAPATTAAITPIPTRSTTSVTTTSVTTTTVVVVAEQPWAVVVVGDFGDGGEQMHQVAAAARAWVEAHPETVAVVTTGDNFYIADVAAAWDEPYGWVQDRGLVVWAVPGNHDLETAGQWQASVDAFGSFPRWRTREVGGVTFVLLDSNQVGSAEQHAWFAATVAGLGERPWIAVFHHPWKSCSRHGDGEWPVVAWEGLLESAKLVLNGHDHNYQRFAVAGGWSVVTGGGGRPLHALEACPPGHPEAVAAEVAFHFLTVSGLGETIEVAVRGVDGVVLDTFTMDLAGLRP